MTATMFRRANYSGWLITNRDNFLAALAAAGHRPHHTRLIAEHVTHRFPDRHTAPRARTVQAVGWVSGDNVDAVIVEVDGSSRRPDGKVYHVTISVAVGAKPVESNAAIAAAVAAGTVAALPYIPLDVTPF